MAEIHPLLEEVLERPDDLDARLVYADWLSEAGDPRGEFIRLQIAGEPEAEMLLREHRDEWTRFLRPAVTAGNYRFINGFVERISLAGMYLDRLPGFFEHAPLREIRLRDLPHFVAQLAGMQNYTRRLAALDLKQANLRGGSFASLLKGRWDSLQRISVSGNAIGQVGIDALVSADLPALRRLNLQSTGISDFSLGVLRQWPALSQIIELSLGGNLISDTSLAHFCAALTSLRGLELPEIGPRTLAALLTSDLNLDVLAVPRTINRAEFNVLQERFGRVVVD